MAQLLCAVALVNVLVENQPDDLSFRFINHKVADFLILLVHPTKADTLVAKSHGAACIVAFPGVSLWSKHGIMYKRVFSLHSHFLLARKAKSNGYCPYQVFKVQFDFILSHTVSLRSGVG